jgi:hypothetical protein
MKTKKPTISLFIYALNVFFFFFLPSSLFQVSNIQVLHPLAAKVDIAFVTRRAAYI